MKKKTLSVLVLTGSLLPLVAQSSETGSAETITGLLMDASCRAIASGRSGNNSAGENAAARQGGEGVRTRTDALGPSHASATGTTGAASNTASPSGSVSPGTGQARRDTEVIPDRSMRRETEASTKGAATAGPSWSSATGTTGAAVDSVPPQATNVPNARRSTGGNANSSPLSSQTETVGDKYSECRPTADSTAFAIHAGGTVFILDKSSNEMVQNQMRNEAFRASMSDRRDASRWMTVTVMGRRGAGDTLHVQSVRK